MPNGHTRAKCTQVILANRESEELRKSENREKTYLHIGPARGPAYDEIGEGPTTYFHPAAAILRAYILPISPMPMIPTTASPILAATAAEQLHHKKVDSPRRSFRIARPSRCRWNASAIYGRSCSDRWNDGNVAAMNVEVERLLHEENPVVSLKARAIRNEQRPQRARQQTGLAASGLAQIFADARPAHTTIQIPAL